MQVETVAAQRSIGGIEHFATHFPVPQAARLPRWMTPGLLKRVGLCLVAAGVLLCGADLLSRSASARNVEPPPAITRATEKPANVKPLWVEVNHPIQLFELAGSAFGKLPLSYRARRRPEGVERQDFLAYGAFGVDAPYLELVILRTGSTPETVTFLDDMARVAANTHISVVRSGLPSTVPTRFGDFATADLTLARGETAHPCLGFRLNAPERSPAPVEISGFACGTVAKPMDRDTLACVLDRIDLVSAGDDSGLQDFFVDAERRRDQDCNRSRLLAAGSRNMWLDGEAAALPLKHLGTAPRQR